jgi:hypothetical protein
MKILLYLLPFVFPLWILGYPAYCYWSEYDRVVPTWSDIHTPNAEWAHGLSLIPLIFVASFSIAILAHALVLVVLFSRRSWAKLRCWMVGSLLGLASFTIALYLFGNLMDI